MATVSTQAYQRRLRWFSALSVRAGNSVALGGLSGLLFGFAMPPYQLWWLAWLMPVPLLLVVWQRTTREAIAAAYICGLVATSQASYGVFAYDPGAWLAIFLIAPVWMVLPVVVLRFLPDKSAGWSSIIAVPVLWVASETLFQRFLLLPIDYALTQTSALGPLQLAAWLGSAGITFLIFLAGAMGARALLHQFSGNRKNALAWFLAAVSIPLVVGVSGLGTIPEQTRSGDCEMGVSIAQPAVSFQRNRDSWLNPALRGGIRRDFNAFLDSSMHSPSRILVWPEGSGAFTNLRLGDARNTLADYSKNQRKQLFISAVDFDEQGNKFNSIFAMMPSGALEKYDKLTPVPVAEDTLSAGSDIGLLNSLFGKVGAMVCFEVCFPRIARNLAENDPRFLLVSASVTAFGVSSLPALHQATSVLRAVENRRSVVHASNGGPSALIDPWGRITASTHLWEDTVLQGCVAESPGTSFFTRAGHRLRDICLLAGGTLLMFGLMTRGRRRQPHCQEGAGPTAFRLVIQVLAWGLLSLVLIGMNMRFTGWQAAPVLSFQQIHNTFRHAPEEFPQPNTETKDPSSSGREVLAYLASYYGVELPPHNPELAFLSPGKRMSFAELTDSTKALGFEVHKLEDRATALNLGPHPLLVGFGNIGYGVVLHASPQDVMFFEPHTALNLVPRDFFEHLWDGRAVRLVPPALLSLNGDFRPLVALRQTITFPEYNLVPDKESE